MFNVKTYDIEDLHEDTTFLSKEKIKDEEIITVNNENIFNPYNPLNQ